MQNRIDIQLKKLQQGNPTIHLSSSCRINNGIGLLTDEQKKHFIKLFDERSSKLRITYFIPASGSGSRMFDALYNFLDSANPKDETIEFVEHLINSVKDLAFYNKLPQNVKDDLESGNVDIHAFIRLLLFEDGFNFGNLPKGLIPFHRYGNFIVNPFQEHILQGFAISGEKSGFHFTINEVFENRINDSIRILKEITGIEFHHQFTVQNPDSNAFAFDENLNAVKDESGNLITRPAGHGALLSNLNSVDSDLVFIRNIDNIQHQNSSTHAIETRKFLGGILIQFQKLLFEILAELEQGKNCVEKIEKLNQEFDLRIPQNKIEDKDYLFEMLNRPIRICGMVKNEGQPGGGPFWIADQNGFERRQIVEKSQISHEPSQLAAVIKSTHFNPVELVCSFKNFKGEKFDLNAFKNDDLYFIVKKTHQGKPISYIEEPGLWNGGMEKWTTLFYEIESDCFSPVKTVLDLLKDLHR